ncbi:MAG TPA: hypothetical protein VI758_12810 [Bacteroidota bacterium]
MAAKSSNPAQPTSASKDAARQCLLQADKFLKELNFKLCKEQLQKAKELDPTNPYIYAFEDRIVYFEQQEKKKSDTKVAKPVVLEQVQEAVAKNQAGTDGGNKTGDHLSVEEQRRKEAEARAVAEEQRRKELEARVAAEERKRKELEAKIAAEEKKRAELETRRKTETADPTEDLIRKEIETRIAQERKKQDADIWASTEARLVEERRRQEDELRAAVEVRIREERIKKEMESRLLEERMKKEAEIQAAVEARLTEEKWKQEVKERILRDRQKQEDEMRASLELKYAEADRRREEESKASLEARLAEEKLKQEVEARTLEEQRRKEAEARAAEERKKAEEMRRQLEELTQALEQEKKAREEISTKNLQNAVKQLRASMEVAWVNGSPKEEVSHSLHDIAVSLSIPPEVEQSVQREVKLEMYSRAVKEVISKRKLLRNSSSTLEWIRKVYQVSVSEYLENESKFLLDLVADQYKGTVLFVSRTIGTKEDLTPRLKSSGFAVVQSPTPEGALEKIEKINPNVILCDSEFPEGGLSGMRFLHVIRASSKFNFVPFIFLAEAGDVGQLQSSELKPNEGFVKKPIDWEELTSRINEKLQHFREYISSLG